MRAMKLGAQDYVSKPFDVEDLKLTIRKALETRILRRDVARFQVEAAQGSTLDDLVGISRAVARELGGLPLALEQAWGGVTR